MTNSGAEWWRGAVFYQIYPRSFQDSNGDGIGDLEGILQRLDYLNDGTQRSLGVDAIWLSPTFPSPMKDFGYDVSDYEAVHPDFGDLAAMDRLIAACHARGIRLLLDFVPNHSSDQHRWFKESRSARDSATRDWYIWRDAQPDGYLPNNWIAVFGGPAWTFDVPSGQYYLHSFLPEQPDLNWRNPAVEQAMHDVLRFWMARGIDGFRIDVMGMVLKHPDLPDNPPNPDFQIGQPEHDRLLPINMVNYPDVYDAVKGIRLVLDEYPDTVTVGEVFGTAEQIGLYYGGPDAAGLHLAFNFNLMQEGELYTRWDAAELRRIVADAEATLPSNAQPCYALANHDRSRFISRHDHDGSGQERARASALLLLGLRSTPFLYYGEEIGMTDVDVPPEQQQDPARFLHIGRDPERTPMQWDATPGRGFTSGVPWLPFGDAAVNVAAQLDDPDSLLALFRAAIHTRKREPSLCGGALRVAHSNGDWFAFERLSAEARPVLCVINTATHAIEVELPAPYSAVLLATRRAGAASVADGQLQLAPLAAAWLT
jgi:alpha-glucosidase